MKVCVSGWYFRPDFLTAVATSGLDSFVIKHREGKTCGLPSQLYPNLGLEFGAYRQYVENHWDGESDVLFIHDDTIVTDWTAFEDVQKLGPMGVDQAYIFHDENGEYVNGGCHGRAIWMRGQTLRLIRDDFPADMENEGITSGINAQKGIVEFHKKVMTLSPNTGVIAIVPQFEFGHRGRIHERMFVYRKTHHPVPGGLVNVCE